MSKHTKGQWVVQQWGRDDEAFEILSSDGKTIASLEYREDGEDEQGIPAPQIQANARLMTAAPAYARAWGLVPQEIKDRIFDTLRSPDTEWVEAAITSAKGD